MNIDAVGNILIAVLLLCWIGYRQTTWRPAVPGRMWRMPVVLAVAGIASVSTSGVRVTGLDVAVVAIELVISLGVGAWMGGIAHFRRLDPPLPVGHADAVARYESRTGWWGLALWGALVLVRIGMDIFAARLGAEVASSLGMILLLLAANRAARVAVFTVRLDRHHLAAAGEPLRPLR